VVRSAFAALLLAGCDVIFPLADPPTVPVVDAPPAIDGPSTALCFGRDLVQGCLDQAPTQPFIVGNAGREIDTASALECASYTVNGVAASDLCIIPGTRVVIDGMLRGIGVRPLVLVSATDIVVMGTIDVSSARGLLVPEGAGAVLTIDGVDCPELTQMAGVEGGGAGGSFGAPGGNGTNAGGRPAVVVIADRLRGGCRGGGGGQNTGSAGSGGGAVALIAGTQINMLGTINASGGGGRGGNNTARSGGGGGGSGGMILLDGEILMDASSQTFANGGGGGEGAGNGPNVQGCNGGELLTTMLAGQNAIPDGGSTGGGGGGGGGVGVIRVFPSDQLLGGQVSPLPPQ
jgi:hypothetical protein